MPLVPLAQRQAQAAMAITRRWIYRQAKPRLEKLFSLPMAVGAEVQGRQATTAQAEEVLLEVAREAQADWAELANAGFGRIR